MTTYVIRRLLYMIPTLFFVALITFVLMHAAPGGPWDRDLEARQVDKTTQTLLSKRFGLDKPLFLTRAAAIPWTASSSAILAASCAATSGPSYRQRGLDVQDILFKPPEGKPFWYSKFGYSVRLGILAVFLACLFGIPLGILGALKRNTFWDYVSLLISTIGVSVPNFVLAIFFIIIFASKLKLVKIVQQNWNSPGAWLVPAVILGFGTFAYITRLTRSSMLEVMQQDYVRTARAKGLAERVVILRHMLRNALIPVVTILGPALAGLVVGSFIIEQMFAFPGSGRAFVLSIQQRDYSMIMGTTLIYAILIAFANLSVDVVYGFLDPRIKVGD